MADPQKPSSSQASASAHRGRTAAVATLLAAVAGSAGTVALTSPTSSNENTGPESVAIVLFVGCGVLALTAIVALWVSVRRELLPEDGQSQTTNAKFGLHLTGVGVCMLVSGLIASAVLAALVQSGVLALTQQGAATDPLERYTQAVHLLTASGLAMVGSLFFVANTLWSRGYGTLEREPFDAGHFWGGLALRMGEAQVFTLVLAVVLAQQGRLSYQWLPLLGLLFGMYVKTAEAIVFGLARRVFAVATTLVEAPKAAPAESTPASVATAQPQSAPEGEGDSPPGEGRPRLQGIE